MYTRIRTASLQPFLKLNFSYRQIIHSVQLIPTHPQFKMETFFKKKKKKTRVYLVPCELHVLQMFQYSNSVVLKDLHFTSIRV